MPDMDYYAYSNDVFTLSGFLSEPESEALIGSALNIGFEPATFDDGAGQVLNSAVRNNQRIIFDDIKLANKLWIRLQPKIKQIDDWIPLGLNERFRLYRYDRYQSFKWHRDIPFKRSANEQSWLTFMIYLNGGYDGGFTDFEDFKVWPEPGMAVCFKHKLRHEGAPVTLGTKYVLRSDVMFKRSA